MLWKKDSALCVRLKDRWAAFAAPYTRRKDKQTQRIPYRWAETDALEAWLEEQASEGLWLERFWGGWAVFQKDTPNTRLRFRMERVRYHLGEEGQQRIAICKEAGWNYVATYRDQIIYQSERLEAEELPPHPDPPEEAKYTHAALPVLFITAILLILFSLLSIVTLSRLEWIEYAFFEVSAVLTAGILVFFFAFWEMKILHDLEDRIEDGDFSLRNFHTKQRAKRRVRITFLQAIVILPLLLTLIFVPKSGSSSGNHPLISLTSYEEALPIPLLADVNPKEGASLDAIASQDLLQNMAWRDELREDSRFLLPRHLWIWQEGTHVRKDGNQIQRLNYYNACYYELRTENLAAWLFEDLLPLYHYEALPASQDIQAFYLRTEQEESPAMQNLLLRHKNIIYEINYRGQSDLDTCLPLFEAAARAAAQA